MSKTIKLDDDVYERLERWRGKRETFSDAVARLQRIHEAVGSLQDIIEGQIAFQAGQRERLEKEAASH